MTFAVMKNNGYFRNMTANATIDLTKENFEKIPFIDFLFRKMFYSIGLFCQFFRMSKLKQNAQKLFVKLNYLSDLFFPIYHLKLRALKMKYVRLQHELTLKTENYEKTNGELKDLYIATKRKADDFRSSIVYAKSIQDAVLPMQSNLNRFFKTFVFYQPKDIISGDFYWISKNLSTDDQNYKVCFALADCTGHGVPGALLSLIGERLISEAIYVWQETNPSAMLNFIDTGFQSTLQQKEMNNKEGMDASICTIEKTDAQNFDVSFAGARHNLVYFCKATNKTSVIKGDRKTIGGFYNNILVNSVYTNHKLTMQQGDRLFFYTDGFIDQFNKNGKKLSSRKLFELIETYHYLTIDKIGKALEFEWTLHRQFERQLDDVTVIGIEL